MLQIINWLENHLLTCPYKHYFKIDCPGCGFQRSFIYLLKGDVANSFYTYPPLIPILTLFTYLVVHIVKKFNNGGKHIQRLYIFCVVIICVNYIYKIITHQL
jgi:hypothetical protein